MGSWSSFYFKAAHPVSKLSKDRCYSPFKKNSSEVSKVHPRDGKCPLGSVLSSRYTLLPPRCTGKVTSELIPKWFLQSDHVDEAVGYFYWSRIIAAVITFTPSGHTSLLLHLVLGVTVPAAATFRLEVTMKLEP